MKSFGSRNGRVSDVRSAANGDNVGRGFPLAPSQKKHYGLEMTISLKRKLEASNASLPREH